MKFRFLPIITIVLGIFLSANQAFAATPPVPAAANSGLGTGSSLNWAGYVATAGTYTGVTGTWIVPTITNQTSGADATWVGIGGVSSTDLIQAGTQAIIGYNGQVTYQAWYETLPQATTNVNLTVNPGDSVTGSITEQGTGRWSVSLHDNTNGQSFQTSMSYNSSLSSAEWVEEMPSTVGEFISLDNFGMIPFSNATAIQNGNTVSIAGSGAQTMTMINTANQALATVSSLGSDGASFTVSRTAATPSIARSFGFGRGKRNGTGISGYTPQPQRITITRGRDSFRNYFSHFSFSIRERF